MKQSVLLLGIVFTLASMSALANIPPAGSKYIGSNQCKACHNMPKTGKQYAAWESSAHANAFKTLQTPAADKIAAEKGHKTKAAETAECLTCHVTGHDVKGAQFDAKFAKTEGVGCEACHGAGEGYKTKHAKKETLKDAIAAGLELPKVADGSAEKQCKTCHNEKSPTYKGFKFQEYWKKIAHPLPKS
jgi:hypothetical protein